VSKVYTVAEVCRFVGWNPAISKHYQRVWVACGIGAAGTLLRTGHGFVLDEQNLATVIEYLRAKWPNEVPADVALAAQG
jgi:hypothetical protein